MSDTQFSDRQNPVSQVCFQEVGLLRAFFVKTGPKCSSEDKGSPVKVCFLFKGCVHPHVCSFWYFLKKSAGHAKFIDK